MLLLLHLRVSKKSFFSSSFPTRQLAADYTLLTVVHFHNQEEEKAYYTNFSPLPKVENIRKPNPSSQHRR